MLTNWIQCRCTVSQPNRQVVVSHGCTQGTASYAAPSRPDDNNRLESSSKGSSCPAKSEAKRS